MYQAELMGKLSGTNEEKEDILTSNVFSFFKYSNRKIFLYQFLKNLGLQIIPEDAINAEFEFWPQYADHTEPDVVIIVGKYYLLFEAKFLSGFGEETEKLESQIKRELKQGSLEAANQDKDFFYIPITANYVHPKSLDNEVPKEYQKQCRWTNWQKVGRLLTTMLTEETTRLNTGEREFTNDLFQLLIKKKLGTFNGLTSFIQNVISFQAENVFFKSKDLIPENKYFDFSEYLTPSGIRIQKIENVFVGTGRFTMNQEPGLRLLETGIFYKGDQNGKRNHD